VSLTRRDRGPTRPCRAYFIVANLLGSEHWDTPQCESGYQLTAIAEDGLASAWLLPGPVAAVVAQGLRDAGVWVTVLPSDGAESAST
jgi:hypothetical protein